MTNAHFNSKAAGQPVFGTALVRRLLACALIGCAAMSAAHAGPGWARFYTEPPAFRLLPTFADPCPCNP